MIETVESRLKKLEGRHRPQNRDDLLLAKVQAYSHDELVARVAGYQARMSPEQWRECTEKLHDKMRREYKRKGLTWANPFDPRYVEGTPERAAMIAECSAERGRWIAEGKVRIPIDGKEALPEARGAIPGAKTVPQEVPVVFEAVVAPIEPEEPERQETFEESRSRALQDDAYQVKLRARIEREREAVPRGAIAEICRRTKEDWNL